MWGSTKNSSCDTIQSIDKSLHGFPNNVEKFSLNFYIYQLPKNGPSTEALFQNGPLIHTFSGCSITQNWQWLFTRVKQLYKMDLHPCIISPTSQALSNKRISTWTSLTIPFITGITKNCGHNMDPRPKWTHDQNGKLIYIYCSGYKICPSTLYTLQLGSCAHAHPTNLFPPKILYKMSPSAPCHWSFHFSSPRIYA